jgi:hypothetical protein
MFEKDVSPLISVYLRNTDLPPLRGGRVFKPVPGVETPGRRRYALARPRHRSYDAKNLAATKALRSRAESFGPFLLRHPELRRTGRGRNRMLSEPLK